MDWDYHFSLKDSIIKKTFLIFVATLLSGCLMAGQSDQKDLPVLKGPYLGQKPPGMTPEVFAPVPLQADKTWFWHGSPSFSPAGSEIHFVKYIKGKNVTEIFRIKMACQIWAARSNPVEALRHE